MSICQRLTFFDRLVQKEGVSIPVNDLALVIEPYRQITQVSLKKLDKIKINEIISRTRVYAVSNVKCDPSPLSLADLK